MEIYVKVSFISTFSLFTVFKHNFIKCIDFTCFAPSKRASDDITYWVKHSYYILVLIL